MKKLSKKQKANLVYKQIFRGTALEKGDILKFRRGKALWQVKWQIESQGFYLSSVTSEGYAARRIYPRDFIRIYLVDKKEFLKWILRNQPRHLSRYFPNSKKLLKMLRKIVPSPKL